jgi:prepilin-type N-terminal cleavage/methylation domain-containing protein
MSTHGRHTCSPGFTLLEVLVAVAILGVGLISLLGLHVRNLALLARDQRVTESTLLAQGLMAEVDVGGLASLGSERGTFEEEYPGRYPDLGWEREVLPTPFGDLLGDLQEVRVRVFQGDGTVPAADDVTLVYYARVAP